MDKQSSNGREHSNPMLDPHEFHTRTVQEVLEDIQAIKPVYLDRALYLAEGKLSTEAYRTLEWTYMSLQYELTRALALAGIERTAIEEFLLSDSHIPSITEDDFELFIMSELSQDGAPRPMALVIGELAFHQALDRHLRGLPKELSQGKTGRAFYLNADKVLRLEKELEHLRAVEQAGAAESNTVNACVTNVYQDVRRGGRHKPSTVRNS